MQRRLALASHWLAEGRLPAREGAAVFAGDDWMQIVNLISVLNQ